MANDGIWPETRALGAAIRAIRPRAAEPVTALGRSEYGDGPRAPIKTGDLIDCAACNGRGLRGEAICQGCNGAGKQRV